MKKPAKTAGFRTKIPGTKESEVNPIVRWWPIQTPRLKGEPFENPVVEIPKSDSPLKHRGNEA